MVNSSPIVEVYCTRPSCKDPKNTIPEKFIATKPIGQRFCASCGMSLILEQRFLPLRQLVPEQQQGGFGRTFLAQDLSFQERRLCVVKQLHPKNPPTESQLEVIEEMFKREGKVLQELRHPQIPRALAFFKIEANPDLANPSSNRQSFFYLIQEYIEGKNLLEILQEKQFLEAEVLDFLQQLLEILKYVHGQRVIHRDIKPPNIVYCDKDKKFYLIDFGAVKQVVQEGVPTEQSVVIGTPAYAPPEQKAGNAVSSASDLYSLAATCVHLLTGRNPTELRNREDQWNWRQYTNVSEHLAEVLDRMLLPQLEQRLQSAEEVQQVLNGSTLPPIPPYPPKPSSPQPQYIRTTILSAQPLIQQFKRLLRKWWIILGLVLLGLAIAIAIHQIIFSPSTDSTVISNYFTRGEESLIPENDFSQLSPTCQQAFDHKKEAMRAFSTPDFVSAKDNFQTAIDLFKQASNDNLGTRKCSVDPETQIFLNNAKANIQGNPITIAVVVPINQNATSIALAQQILRGVAHVQDKLNNQNGGIRNQLLQVIIVRDNNDPQTARDIAKYLAQNNIPNDPSFNGNVLGVIGNFTSDVTLAAGEIYESEQLVAISPTSTAVRRNQPSPSGYQFNLTEYVFRTAPDDSVAVDDLFQYVYQEKQFGKGIILFNKTKRYSWSLKEAFETKFGSGNLISCDLSQTTVYRCALEHSQDVKSVKFVMLALSSEEASNLGLSAINLFKNQQILLLGGDTLYSDDNLSFGEIANGLVVAIPTHVDATDSDFNQESIKLWGTKYVGWRAATAYDAAQIMVKGIEEQSNNPTRQGLYNILNDGLSTKGATGTVRFNPQHDRLVIPEDGNKIGVLGQVKQKCKPEDKPQYRFCLIPQ